MFGVCIPLWPILSNMTHLLQLFFLESQTCSVSMPIQWKALKVSKHFLQGIFLQPSNSKWLLKCDLWYWLFFGKKIFIEENQRQQPCDFKSLVEQKILIYLYCISLWTTFNGLVGQPNLPLEIRNCMNTASILRQEGGKKKDLIKQRNLPVFPYCYL